MDFATNRLAVLSHGLAVCALRDLEKREREADKSERKKRERRKARCVVLTARIE